MARFQREAQVLASLNHPNIAAIHGLEESDGQQALVLELVEGPTLADRIKKGPIPVDEALPIAKQIAEALEAAHEAGVIHRDLKPANIKVRDDGTVKVLDFGLAKALDTTPEGDPSQSPTLTAAATQMGVIMGTAAYMSPEQARGKPVDKRADIWAFGAVFFEMLTGQMAFSGGDLTDTIAAVIRSEPPWDALPDNIAPRLNRILRVCLQKERSHRVRDIGDVQLAIEGAFEANAEASAVADTSRRTRERLIWVVAVTAASLVTGAIVWSLRSGSPPAPVEYVSVPLPPGVIVPDENVPIALSPDGRHLVYAGSSDSGSQLYHRPLDQRAAVPIPGTDNARFPFFSPDGQWIGFKKGRDLLQKVALAGGEPVTICELWTGTVTGGVAWGPDDQIWIGSSSGLHVVPAAGGIPRPLVALADGEIGHGWPRPLRNGNGAVWRCCAVRKLTRNAPYPQTR